MAQDDKPTAADKGKGKAVENGKAEEVPKDKDGKPLANGKKEDDKDECMRRCTRPGCNLKLICPYYSCRRT